MGAPKDATFAPGDKVEPESICGQNVTVYSRIYAGNVRVNQKNGFKDGHTSLQLKK